MESKIWLTINLFFFILITNTQFSQAHNSLNGGCNNHCKESVIPITIENDLNIINEENRTQDNYSCLNRSLCRG